MLFSFAKIQNIGKEKAFFAELFLTNFHIMNSAPHNINTMLAAVFL